MNRWIKCLATFFALLFGAYGSAADVALQTSSAIISNWNTGYVAAIAITNSSSTPVSSWSATFALQQGQLISCLWNGTYTQNNQSVTVTNNAGGGTLQPGQSTTFGFQANNPSMASTALTNLTAVGATSVTPPSGFALSASSHIDLVWATAYQATVTLTNNTSTATSSWTATFTLPQGNSLSSHYSNGIFTVNGNTVTVANLAGRRGYFSGASATFNMIINMPQSGTVAINNLQAVANGSPTPPPPPPATAAIIEGYWESWNSADTVTTLANMHVDVIDISFGNFTSLDNHTFQVAGVMASSSAIQQLVSTAHSLGKKVKISIGGATYPLQPQLQTTQDAVGMAQAIANYVQQFSLDGVHFDIEDYPPANLQIALIQNTRQLLGNNAIISYTAKTPASSTTPYQEVIAGAYPYFSYTSLMAYDAYPGYSYMQDIAALVSMGTPAAKIVLGLMPGVDDVGMQTSLNDISAGAQYVKQNGLQGIMFWDLNRDLENVTGLGASAATNTAYSILK